jgi:hypothetical protein
MGGWGNGVLGRWGERWRTVIGHWSLVIGEKTKKNKKVDRCKSENPGFGIPIIEIFIRTDLFFR